MKNNQQNDDQFSLSDRILVIIMAAATVGVLIWIYVGYRAEKKEIEKEGIELRRILSERHQVRLKKVQENRNSSKIVIRKQHCPIKTYHDKKRVSKRFSKIVTLHTKEEWRVWFRRIDTGDTFMLNVNSQQFDNLELNEQIDTIK